VITLGYQEIRNKVQRGNNSFLPCLNKKNWRPRELHAICWPSFEAAQPIINIGFPDKTGLF
jgi:hypothetical protein